MRQYKFKISDVTNWLIGNSQFRLKPFMPFLKFSQRRLQARVGQGLPAKDRIIQTSRKPGGVDPNFLYSRTTSGVATSRKIRTGRKRFAVFFSATFRRMKTASRKKLVEVGGWGRDVKNESG